MLSYKNTVGADDNQIAVPTGIVTLGDPKIRKNPIGYFYLVEIPIQRL